MVFEKLQISRHLKEPGQIESLEVIDRVNRHRKVGIDFSAQMNSKRETDDFRKSWKDFEKWFEIFPNWVMSKICQVLTWEPFSGPWQYISLKMLHLNLEIFLFLPVAGSGFF